MSQDLLTQHWRRSAERRQTVSLARQIAMFQVCRQQELPVKWGVVAISLLSHRYIGIYDHICMCYGLDVVTQLILRHSQFYRFRQIISARRPKIEPTALPAYMPLFLSLSPSVARLVHRSKLRSIELHSVSTQHRNGNQFKCKLCVNSAIN